MKNKEQQLFEYLQEQQWDPARVERLQALIHASDLLSHEAALNVLKIAEEDAGDN
jgi:hypothetical protein